MTVVSINVLTGETVGVGAAVVTDVECIALAIALEFPAPTPYSADMWTAALVGDIIVSMPPDVLTDLKVNGFEVTIAALEFAMPASV